MSTAADDRADREMGRPTVDDVEQRNFDTPAVPVRVTDPVAVQLLPVLHAHSRTFTVALNATEKLLNEDKRRSRALVTVDGGACYVGTDQQGTVSGTSAFLLPAGTVVELRSVEQWWIRPADAETVVSVMSEQWAD